MDAAAHGPYVGVRVGFDFEPATFRTKGNEITTEPPRLFSVILLCFTQTFVSFQFQYEVS